MELDIQSMGQSAVWVSGPELRLRLDQWSVLGAGQCGPGQDTDVSF